MQCDCENSEVIPVTYYFSFNLPDGAANCKYFRCLPVGSIKFVDYEPKESELDTVLE